MGNFRQKYLDGVAVPLGLLVIIIALIVTIGTIFINTYQGGEKDRLDRPELWIGVGILVGVIALMAILARMPEDAGFLGRDVAIGSTGMWDEALPPVDVRATMGQPGTISDIQAGYTLYARSGALAHVNGLLPGGVDYGRRFSGMMYAQGVKSAAKEMWIPYEAVIGVYPEAKAAFLAIQGDEAESLGWTAPPEGITRGAPRRVDPNDRVK